MEMSTPCSKGEKFTPAPHVLSSITMISFVVYGCVREVDELEDMNLGIQALASIPVGATSQGIGELDVPVNFGGVSFLPEDYIYADSTGIILSPEPLNIDLELDEEA